MFRGKGRRGRQREAAHDASRHETAVNGSRDLTPRPAAPGSRGADLPSAGGFKSLFRQLRASGVLCMVRKRAAKGHGGAQTLGPARPGALDPQRWTRLRKTSDSEPRGIPVVKRFG